MSGLNREEQTLEHGPERDSRSRHADVGFALLPEYAQAAYDAAVGPKQLVWIETHNHIELYDHRFYVEQAIQAVVPWLQANVGSEHGPRAK